MLGFLRKHQKYFFVIITIVIVTSFSFFGTYGTLGSNNAHEQIAFTSINGTPITRGELEELAQFISTDQEDAKLYGGAIGPNFLNDGVIRKDFLETGLAATLLEAYQTDFQSDLSSKHVREANFKPYVHPEAPFVSSMTVWNYFAPEIVRNLELVQKEQNPLSKEALQAKIALYLAEKRLPSPYLRQFLYHQERQYSWLPHDENLDYQDLSLFGYHTPDDWFGPKFSKLIAQFIINSAQIAEERGYKVSKEEALADLMRNAQLSFKENQNSSLLTAHHPTDYFQQQLVRMRLDRTKAVNLWQQVMLFRRLFQDIGNSVLVDRTTYDTFNQFANETLVGDAYRLPQDFRFKEFKDLAHFEAYLNAISRRSKEEQAKLSLPNQFLKVEEIAKRHPELVHKRYLVELTKASKRALQSRVSLKEMLNFEVADVHWKELKIQFPELGLKEAKTPEERLGALEKMDPITRSRVDQFARSAIVKEHPEWIAQALDVTPTRKEIVSIRLKGESPSFAGLQLGEELISLLDKAPLNEQDGSLSQISFDGENYYRIIVNERSESLEVLPYREAQMTGIVEKLLDQKLEPYYVQIRNEHPDKFQNSDLSWKPLDEVKATVAELYLEPVTKSIKADFAKRQNLKNQEMTADRAASLRFYAFLDRAKEAIQKEPSQEGKWVQEKVAELNSKEHLAKAEPIDQQWKLQKEITHLKRKSQGDLPYEKELFQLSEASYSKIYDAPNGDLYFFYLKEKKAEDNPEVFEEQIARARFLLGREAEQRFLDEILPTIKERNAISLNYNRSDFESIEPEEK
ncbi:MAG: SurA N-terminal domain-containing protein [Parachlamydiaceae bacterium]